MFYAIMLKIQSNTVNQLDLMTVQFSFSVIFYLIYSNYFQREAPSLCVFVHVFAA